MVESILVAIIGAYMAYGYLLRLSKVFDGNPETKQSVVWQSLDNREY